MPSRAPDSRILELDALRGLAAVAVVAFHYTTRYDQLFGRDEPLAWTAPWGHYGVDLFFMLSGFVILMTLERTGGWLAFAWGRFSRLYPAYWVAALGTFLVVALFGLPGQEASLRDALLNATMVQSLLDARHIDGAYWSLQAELIFYANMLVLHRGGLFRRPLVAVVGWLAASATAAGLLAADSAGWIAGGGVVGKIVTVTSLEYIPLFGVGITLYAWRTGRASGVATVGVVALCVLTEAALAGVTAAAVAAGLAAVLAAAVGGRLPALRRPALVYLGALSYPLYLTHQNIGYVVMREADAAGWSTGASLVGAIGVAAALAAALHHGVERPSLAWLRARRPDSWKWRPLVGSAVRTIAPRTRFAD